LFLFPQYQVHIPCPHIESFCKLRRIGKGFSGVDTPLFDAMLVQQQVHDDVAEVEEDDNKEDASKQGEKIAELDADKDVTLVDVDVDIQGRMEEDVTTVKDINAAETEPTVFDDKYMAKRLQDEEIEQVAARERQGKEDLERAKVRPIFEREYKHVQTFLKSDRDEEPTKKRLAKETLLQESFKKLKAKVKVSGSHSTQEETPTVDPAEISKEDV
nr:hypothetical protein [Tanacetum cinerariifolium]